MNKHLVTKILIPTLTVIILGMAALGYFSFRGTRTSLQEDVVPDLVRSLAGDAKSAVESRIAAAVETSILLADDPAIARWLAQGEPGDELQDLVLSRLDRLTTRASYFHAFLVSAETLNYWGEGNQLVQTVDPDDSEDSWFFDSLAMSGRYALNLDYNPTLNVTALFVNVPVEDGGSRVAVTGVGLQLEDIIPRETAIAGGDLYLIDSEGMILASSRSDVEGTSLFEMIPGYTASNVREETVTTVSTDQFVAG
jgi:hypothetical protein